MPSYPVTVVGLGRSRHGKTVPQVEQATHRSASGYMGYDARLRRMNDAGEGIDALNV